MATVGRRSAECLKTVEPEFGKAVLYALKMAPDYLDFAVISGMRLTQEQQAMYLKGRDENGEVVDESLVVTWKDGVLRLSRHQDKDGNGYGEAIDIMAFKGGRGTFDEYEIEKRAAYIIGFCAARGIKLDGGVRWGWDQGHLEMR